MKLTNRQKVQRGFDVLNAEDRARFEQLVLPHLDAAFGARANRTVLRMLAHGRVTSGSTGEKTAWSSALFPRPLLLTWSDSIGS
jgi:hypothetical protein